MTTEEWRPIAGWEDRYEVSSLGRVRSWVGPNGHQRKTPKILAYRTSSDAIEPQVALARDGVTHARMVGRLVLEAFVGPAPRADSKVFARNGDMRDVRLVNLAWGKRRYAPEWERKTIALLDAAEIARIKASSESDGAIAKRLGVARSTVQRARRKV